MLALSITVAAGLFAAASALAAGSISGTVTAAGTGAPIAGAGVCAHRVAVGAGIGACAKTDAAGKYTIEGLTAAPDYEVEFTSSGFIFQTFNHKEPPNVGDPVVVNDGATTTGIDAVMDPGAAISGHATEQGTGAPARDVRVCARLDPTRLPFQNIECAHTDRNGDYVLPSLKAGSYWVVFEPVQSDFEFDQFAEHFYSDSAGNPTQIMFLTPPETRSHIDATLVNQWATLLHPGKGIHAVTGDSGVIFTRHKQAKIGFRFSAHRGVEGFSCKRDHGPWGRCRSPERFSAPLGAHTFRVRALVSGDTGPAAVYRFRVRREAR
jgi:hypothetical protein